MQIKDLGVGFYEVGKIKIGCAGEARKAASGREFHIPRKLDHFIVTTNERGPDGNFKPDPIMVRLSRKGENGEVVPPRALPIRLLFDSIEDNFDTSYSYYVGNKCLCRGDGGGPGCGERRKYTKTDKGQIRLTGESERIECPCELLDPSEDGSGNRCKPYGILMCVLEQADSVGGVYKFRTTSRNTIRSITTSLRLILGVSGGLLAGLPLWLTVAPRQVQTPSGQKSLVYVVNVEFRGGIEALGARALETAKVRSASQLEMRQIRKSFALLTMRDTPEDEAAVAEEFHPEALEEAEVVDVTGGEEPKRVMDAEPEPPESVPEPAADLDEAFRAETGAATPHSAGPVTPARKPESAKPEPKKQVAKPGPKKSMF